MRGRKTSLIVVLTEQEENQLLRWSRSTSLPAGLVTRAQAVWMVAHGMPLSHTAKAVGLTEVHVRQWVKRFLEQRLDGLHDRPGRGRKPSFSPSDR
jgi:putative transposase